MILFNIVCSSVTLISMSCRKQRRANIVSSWTQTASLLYFLLKACSPARPAVWRDSWNLSRSGSPPAEPETQNVFCYTSVSFHDVSSGQLSLSHLCWKISYNVIVKLPETHKRLRVSTLQRLWCHRAIRFSKLYQKSAKTLQRVPPHVPATHSDFVGFSENTLSTKSASLWGSKVEGTMTYSPAGSRSRELTSLRLMKSSERALEAWVRKKSRFRWIPDLPVIWEGIKLQFMFSPKHFQTG